MDSKKYQPACKVEGFERWQQVGFAYMMYREMSEAIP